MEGRRGCGAKNTAAAHRLCAYAQSGGAANWADLSNEYVCRKQQGNKQKNRCLQQLGPKAPGGVRRWPEPGGLRGTRRHRAKGPKGRADHASRVPREGEPQRWLLCVGGELAFSSRRSRWPLDAPRPSLPCLLV